MHLPSLRERKIDIPLLTSHFIDRQNEKTGGNISGINPKAMRTILDYNWPGNVRELENAIEHAFVLCTNELIDCLDLPVEIRQTDYSSLENKTFSGSLTKKTERRKLTREILIDVLKSSDWNKAEVGRRVGLSRASIWKYMKKWGIPLQQDD